MCSKMREEELFDYPGVKKGYNKALERQLVKLYVERCKQKHALMFF